jgi:outer membrane protein OmpA-like peptidoglycan-associated protein
LLIAAGGALSASAQTRNEGASTKKLYNADSLLPHWSVDVNLMGGALWHDLTTVNPAGNYVNAVSTNTGELKFSKGSSFGIQGQLGYFFDYKGHFGIGTGLMYMYQMGNMTLDQYRVDYKAYDANGDVYRQVTTAKSAVTEEVKISNWNIPLVLKYRTRCSNKIGFTADAGILFNITTRNNYKTDASFDYEAIYKHAVRGDGSVYTVYDASPAHSTSDLAITREQYLKTHPDGNVDNYFALQRSLGYNVGLNQAPYKTSGSMSYNDGGVGLMAAPSLAYYFNDKVSLNIGAYYIYQVLTYSAGGGSQLTNRVGDYSSVMTNIDKNINHSFGGNIGVRFLFGKLKDSDKDGVPDRKDKCPHVAGVAKFNGCPDKDKDGIPDSEDECPGTAGLIQFHGCPDSDGDGIPDSQDGCPYMAGPARLRGCPDTDGDGVTDGDDKCPNVAGPASNNGCPVEEPKPVKRNYEKPEHDMTEPILFDLGKTTIKEESLPILMEAVMEMTNSENAFVIIDGHTDNTGNAQRNEELSFQRADMVKRYLTKMGADPKRMVAVGHGPRQPLTTNDTKEGRAQNRRVIMSLKHRPKKEQ